MTFYIDPKAKAKLTDVVVLSQKNREPNDNPGAQLAFSMLIANTDLVLFDGGLKSALYTRHASSSSSPQAVLEGVPAVSDAPNLTSLGKHIGKFHWEAELTGYELIIDQGLGGASNITIVDCVVSKFRLFPQEGGTVLVDFQLESPDVAGPVFGKLASLKNREVEILLLPPEVAQQDIEQPKATRGKKATGKAAAAGDGLQDDDNWPFPTGSKPGEFPDGSPEAALAATAK